MWRAYLGYSKVGTYDFPGPTSTATTNYAAPTIYNLTGPILDTTEPAWAFDTRGGAAAEATQAEMQPSRRSGTSGLIYIYGDSRDDFCTHQTFFWGLSHLPTVSRLTSLSFETY